MTNWEIIKLLENEVTCIKRQDGPKCPRFVGMTCAACDLITDTSKVLEALTGAITAIKAQRGGTWKKVNDPEDRLIPVKYYCSACGNWNGYGMAKYCPHCGARVLKPEEKEDASFRYYSRLQCGTVPYQVPEFAYTNGRRGIYRS